MNKAQLIKTISTETGLTKAECTRVINAFIKTVENSIKKNDDVSLVGFGSFCVRKMGIRVGRDFKTKKSISIPPRKSVRFKPGKALKDAVN